MAGRRDYLRLKYWGRIVNYKDSRLVKIIYRYRMRCCNDRIGRDGWCRQTKLLLEDLGLEEYWRNESQVKEIGLEMWDKLIFEKIRQSEEKRWRDNMEKKSKLRTYRQIKSVLRLEQYLIDDSWRLGRKMMTRLRSGTNELEIEKCRWKGVSVEDRLCCVCSNGEVEDEAHAIDRCSLYDSRRNSMWSQIERVTHGRVRRLNDGSDWKNVLLSDTVKSKNVELDRRAISPLVKEFLHYLAEMRAAVSVLFS